MLTFIEAIGRQEGGLIPSSKAQRRNNPGNIEEGKFAQAHGALPTWWCCKGRACRGKFAQAHGALPSDGDRFAAWPTQEAGYAALRTLLTIGYLGLTVAQAINKWAPPVENATSIYLVHVTEWTAMSADTVLTSENIG